MTQQEAQALYAVLLRLVDQGQILTPAERRDILNQIVHARCEQTVDDILAATINQRKLRIKRGTTAENDAYTGLAGEITMDTDENTLRVHDGATPGGHVVSCPTTTAISTCIPDYANGIQNIMTTAEQTYTCPSDGVIVVDTTGFNWNQGYIKINDVTMFCVTTNGNSSFCNGNGQYFVAQGDIVKYKSGYVNASVSTSTNTLIFYPFRTNINTSES